MKIFKNIIYYLFIMVFIFYIITLVSFSNNFKITKSFINISESMGDTIPINSVVVVKKEPHYNVDEIISYYAKIEEELVIVTHRITAISGNVYVTKGDKNFLEDRELVKPRLIIGRVIFVIPVLGRILNFSRTALGLYLSILLPGLIIISLEMKSILFYSGIKIKNPLKKKKEEEVLS